MNKFLFTTFFCLWLFGCSNPKPPKQEGIQAAETKLVGSLAESSSNTPESFFNETVNGRSQFTNNIKKVSDSTFQQTIVNNTDTLSIIATWKKPKDWVMTTLDVSLSKNADTDSLQVFMRFPYRLNNYNEITSVLNKSTSIQGKNISKLSNGATISVEESPEKIGILIQ